MARGKEMSVDQIVCYEVTSNVARYANNMIAETVRNHGEDMPEEVRTRLRAALENLLPVMMGSSWREK